MKTKQWFDYKNMHPFTQGLIALCGTVLVIFFCLLGQIKDMLVWSLLIAPVLLYAIYNPVLGILQQGRKMRYIGLSIISLCVMLLLTLLTGNLLSDYSFKESGTLPYITILLILFFFLLHFVSFIFMQIIIFLQQLDD